MIQVGKSGRRARRAAILVALATVVPPLTANALSASSATARPSHRVTIGPAADVPPLGLAIDTISGAARAVRIGGHEYAPYGHDAQVHLVVVDRTTLEVKARVFGEDTTDLVCW